MGNKEFHIQIGILTCASSWRKELDTDGTTRKKNAGVREEISQKSTEVQENRGQEMRISRRNWE